MNGVANGEVKSPQPQSPMHQPQAQGSNRAQPTLSPHSQDFVPSRTLSAPPDLKEQMKYGMVYTPFKTNYLQEQPHNYQHPEGAPIQFGAQHPVHPATQPLPIHPHMPQPGPVQGYTPPKNAPLPIHPADMAAAKKQPHLQPPINAGPPPGQGPGHMPQGPMGMVPPHYPPHMRPQGMNPVPPNNQHGLNPMSTPFMPPANVYSPVVGYPPQPYYPMQPQVGMPTMPVPGTPPNNFAARPKIPTPPKKVIRIWDPNTGEDLKLNDEQNAANANNNAASNTTANPKTTTGAGNILPELGGAMQTPKEDKPKPAESTKSPLMEVPKETGLKPPIGHAITHKPEEKKSEPVKIEEPKKEETPAQPEVKKEEPKKEVPKPVEEPKKEEVKPKVEEPKKEEPKVEEPKKDVPPKEEPKKEEPKPVEHKLIEPVKIEEPKKTEDKALSESKDDEDNWEKKDEEQLAKEIKEKKVDTTMTLPGASSNKKIYGRDFLLQFQSQFTDKPATLRPDVLNVILGGGEGGGDKTPRGQDRNWRGGNQGRGGNLARSRDSLSSSGTIGQTPKGDRKGRGGRGGATTPRGKKRPDLNASQEPKVKDKSLWSRPEKATDEETELTRKVQSLLNKLTLDKFEVISNKLLLIKVDTLTNLRLIINLLYDKAIIEPKFCTMYAELCKKLSEHYAQLYPEKDEDPEKTLKFSFRRVLLTKCQTEFETKKQLPSLDDAKDPQQKLELEIEASKIRARNKGNIKFIGELYKKRMLTESIMHGCLKTLLGNGSQGQSEESKSSEEDLENFCDLMSNIGGQLDAIDNKKMSKDYFEPMRVLAKSPNIIIRIRFAIEAVMKLRETGWKSKVDNTPKTIKQVHEEAAQKERDQIAREREVDRQRRNVGKTKRPSASGGWAEVASSSGTATGRGKAPVAPAPLLREGIGRGSPVVPRAADKNKSAPPQSSGKNIFSALADSGEAREKPRYEEDDEYSEEEVPKYQIKKRPAAVAPPPESDEEDEEDDEEAPKRYQPTRVASSAPPPDDEEDEEDEEDLARGRGQYSNSEDEDEEYDEEHGGDLESTLDNTLRDFIDDPSDLESVVRDLKPLARDDRARNDMLDKIVLIAIEGAEVTTTRMTEVLAATHRAGLFDVDQITEAFNRVVDQLGDLALDLPKATTLLPVILARGMTDGWLNKSSLGQRINQLSSQEESDLHLIERFIGDIARQLVALKGAQDALKMFNDTQIKVSQVLEQNTAEAVSKFYQSAGLPVNTATAAPAPAPAPKKKKNEYKEVAAQFKKESKPSAIQTFIKSQSPEVTQDPDFVSKLVDCVLALCDQQNSLSHQSFDQKTFNKFKSTFTNYKDLMLQLLGRENVQLAVLQQIQTFVSKNSYPAAFITAIFELLFQHRLASAPAFNTWAKSADADTLAELNKADWFKKIVA
jgi:translation initiation factor 4G